MKPIGRENLIQQRAHWLWREFLVASLLLSVLATTRTSLCAPAPTTVLSPTPAIKTVGLTNDPLCAPGTTNLLRPQQAGTRRMVERLAKIRDEADPRLNPFLSAEAVPMLRAALASAKTPQQIVAIRPMLAEQLLQAGQSEAALQEFDAHVDFVKKLGAQLDSKQRSLLDVYRALCYLRIGEQENCLTNHTSDSCLLPIREGGVHKLTRGSQGAVKILSEHLERYEQDLRARWLLNIAHMTLGEYPDKVPAKWLIPPKTFESDYDIKRFPDIAGAVGLDVENLSGGCVVEDFDGDGFLDLMISSISLSGQLRLFHNNGDGSFTERTAEAGLTGLFGGLNLIQTDYNNDGFPDVLVLRGAWMGAGGHHPNSLLRNNGDGTFDDVTEEAGLLSLHPKQAAVWFDFNGDGWVDLFVGNESSNAEEIHPCELYRNNGDGTFTECAAESGLAVKAFIKGAASADYNQDGRPDLFLSDRVGGNFLFRNAGPIEPGASPKSKWKFTNVTSAAGVEEPMHSFATWFFDYDNDGWPDLFVAGYSIRDVGDVCADYLDLPHSAERARLYHNNHDGTFRDVTKEAGLYKVIHAMGCNFGDLDNDGWLDFYAGTGDPDIGTLIPNRMFRNADGKRFQEVTTSGGFGHLQKGHAIAFADLDNDGDQDVFEQMGGAYSGDTYRNALYLNPGHGNHWLTLNLEGVRSNRAALGARIRVIVATAEGERSIYKTVSSGASFGASPLRQEIGLGQANAIRSVEIFWPATGKTQIIADLSIDRFYKIREGDQAAIAWNLKTFQLPTKTIPGQHLHARE
ncbi:MAG: VCBS repeat-containing protein [Verrucomicrobia bacterium]|nr:VCBS repeat-containing protein [Verrucomicrobiota bacterium]